MRFPTWIFDVTPTERLILGAFLAIIAVWLIRHLVITWAIRGMDFLTPGSPKFQGEESPRITAIIPAKDEEKTLADCLGSVCGQTYPRLDIMVVDDRSTDRTAEIAQRFADSDSRVRVLKIETLPPGWTGKTHALQTAADQAIGEWFWFLDADTRHDPENLAIVLEYALKNKAALVSLLPEMRCETFWEKVVQPLAGIVLMQSFPLVWVNNDSKTHAFANGQYILIKSEVYRAAGGHASVRDRFVEDIYLAKTVKRLGFPIRVALAAFSTLSLAQDAKKKAQAPAAAAASSELKDVKTKASYAIGLTIGRSMKKQGVDIDAKLLAKGLMDVFSDAKPLLTDKEVEAVIEEFQNEINAKLAAAAKVASEKNKKDGEEFLAANKKKEGVQTLPSGLQYKVIKEGNGKTPKATDEVTTHYKGTLIDGTEFDSSYKRGQPATFPVDGVIPGWTEALQKMKVGAKWQLFIPSNLGYAERGSPPVIGPNSTLIFDIELLEVN